MPKSTLRDLLTVNLDITAIPQRSVLEILAHYTDDPTHKERLLEFSNPAYTDEFFDYATRPRRGILEVLQDFQSVKLPFNIVTTVFPVIRGRQYSIASGGIQKISQKDTSATCGQTLKQELASALKGEMEPAQVTHIFPKTQANKNVHNFWHSTVED